MNKTNKKIWAVNYQTLAAKQKIINLQLDNEKIKNNLEATLIQIADFACKIKSHGNNYFPV